MYITYMYYNSDKDVFFKGERYKQYALYPHHSKNQY